MLDFFNDVAALGGKIQALILLLMLFFFIWCVIREANA